MNNLRSNKNVRILFPIVIAIWGLFFLRLFDACNPDETAIVTIEMADFKPPEVSKKFTYELMQIDRDPFLDKSYIKSKTVTKAKKSKVTWPNIQYFGSVSGGNSMKGIFIIGINGQQQLLKYGEEFNGVKLIKVNDESISLRFQGEIKQFEKQ